VTDCFNRIFEHFCGGCRYTVVTNPHIP
jgi:hypothetical protein